MTVRRGIALTPRDIVAALALLTRLPVGARQDDRVGAAAFPIAGLLVGALAAIPVFALGTNEPTIGAILAVAVAAVVTGGLHLDGLADTADALLAPDPARAEVARKDPGVGPGGVVALLLVMAAQVAGLASLARDSGVGPAAAALAAAAAVSRTVPVVAAWRAPRPPANAAGFGAWFATRVRPADAVTAAALTIAIVAVVAAVVGALPIAVAAVLGGVLGLVAARWLVAARGRLDGDGLGAVVELTVAATLVVAAVLVST